jgi:hypothetical protein
MSKIKWYLKQLLPLMYVSEYTYNNERELCLWRMWFGRSYNIKKYVLK